MSHQAGPLTHDVASSVEGGLHLLLPLLTFSSNSPFSFSSSLPSLISSLSILLLPILFSSLSPLFLLLTFSSFSSHPPPFPHIHHRPSASFCSLHPAIAPFILPSIPPHLLSPSFLPHPPLCWLCPPSLSPSPSSPLSHPFHPSLPPGATSAMLTAWLITSFTLLSDGVKYGEEEEEEEERERRSRRRIGQGVTQTRRSVSINAFSAVCHSPTSPPQPPLDSVSFIRKGAGVMSSVTLLECRRCSTSVYVSCIPTALSGQLQYPSLLGPAWSEVHMSVSLRRSVWLWPCL